MSSRRPLILMAVLLVLVLGVVTRPYWAPVDGVGGVVPKPAPVEPPLPGENSISNIVVDKNDAGKWRVSFDYFFTGEPRYTQAFVEAPDGEPSKRMMSQGVNPAGFMIRGTHHTTAELAHPGHATITRQVVVTMWDASHGMESESLVTRASVDQRIEWPTLDQWIRSLEFARRTPDENLQHAIELIDNGTSDSLQQAKALLEQLIANDRAMTQAYVELARVAMKTNWGPEGLHHAEGLLSSALQIEPNHINAKILLGYVYTHQERYKEAEKLFAEAAATHPKNLWLWTNWGEMLARQKKYELAAAKYKEAVDHPMTNDTYDRAREQAYMRLLDLLERKKDWDGVEALYKKATGDFGASTCYGINYARFLLMQRGSAEAAAEIARKALDFQCTDGTSGRQLLGMAYYLTWSNSAGADRVEAMNQARIYLPPGPKAFYLLARSDKTSKAAAQLVTAGEKIDQKDNEQLNALAYAVQEEDVATSRRLLKLGAKPQTPVGYSDIPVALMPVMSRNLELIKLMQEFGADFGKLSYQGATAYEFAKQTGDDELSAALGVKPVTL